MLNQVVLMGRLTRDPELRRTGSGVPVASFSLAVERDRKSENSPSVDFIDCVAWRNTAEFLSKYFSKGRMAVVSGRLQVRSWQDAETRTRKSVEVAVDTVYFGDSKKEKSGVDVPGPAVGPSAYALLEDDDELPF